jgi:hypothetical protein
MNKLFFIGQLIAELSTLSLEIPAKVSFVILEASKLISIFPLSTSMESTPSMTPTKHPRGEGTLGAQLFRDIQYYFAHD